MQQWKQVNFHSIFYSRLLIRMNGAQKMVSSVGGLNPWPLIHESSALTTRPGVLNLLLPAYPQIKIVPLCGPPNQKFYPKGLLFSIFFNFAYTLCPSHVPLGVRVPQVENCCFRPRLNASLFWNFIYGNKMVSMLIGWDYIECWLFLISSK
jgi:hypothetical protein